MGQTEKKTKAKNKKKASACPFEAQDQLITQYCELPEKSPSAKKAKLLSDSSGYCTAYQEVWPEAGGGGTKHDLPWWHRVTTLLLTFPDYQLIHKVNSYLQAANMQGAEEARLSGNQPFLQPYLATHTLLSTVNENKSVFRNSHSWLWCQYSSARSHVSLNKLSFL